MARRAADLTSRPLAIALLLSALACGTTREEAAPAAALPAPEPGTYVTGPGSEVTCLARLGPAFPERSWAVRCSLPATTLDSTGASQGIEWMEAAGAASVMSGASGATTLVGRSTDCAATFALTDPTTQILSLRFTGPCQTGGPLTMRLTGREIYLLFAPDSSNARDSESDADRRIRHATVIAAPLLDSAIGRLPSELAPPPEDRETCLREYARGVSESWSRIDWLTRLPTTGTCPSPW